MARGVEAGHVRARSTRPRMRPRISAISSCGCTPFMATSMPRGATWRADVAANVARSANAREITTSNGASSRRSSTRDGVRGRIGERELDRGLGEERGFLVVRIHHHDAPVRVARSRAECRERRRREPTSSTRNEGDARQMRQHRERVEQVMRDHARGLADRGQVVRLVPLREQRQVARQAALAAGRRARARARRAPRAGRPRYVPATSCRHPSAGARRCRRA